jgi:trans-aconitate 2-methyltransferase
MLANARLETDRVEWRQAKIEKWTPDKVPDLIYSNAALHWLPDHQRLLPRLTGLTGFLAPGGCLAVQMPLSLNLKSHRLMRETLVDCGSRGHPLGTQALWESVSRNPVKETGEYFDLLEGYSEYLDIWESEYLQVLIGLDPVFEWVKGTGLGPILLGLDEQELDVFLPIYKTRLREAYPVRAHGQTLYAFKRLFIVAAT